MKRVLVVENEEAASVAIMTILLGRYSATLVHDTEMAVTFLRFEGPFDLVIVDRFLPHCNGLDFLVSVRKMSGWADLPFILLDETADRDTMLAAQRKKVPVIHKRMPGWEEKLLRAIEELLVPKKAKV